MSMSFFRRLQPKAEGNGKKWSTEQKQTPLKADKYRFRWQSEPCHLQNTDSVSLAISQQTDSEKIRASQNPELDARPTQRLNRIGHTILPLVLECRGAQYYQRVHNQSPHPRTCEAEEFVADLLGKQ